MEGLLRSRLLVVNAAGAFFLYLAYIYGILAEISRADPSGLSWGIVGVFCYGMWHVAKSGWYLGKELDAPAEWDAALLREQLSAKLGVIDEVASSLVKLGLLGTLLGVFMALGHVKPSLELAELGATINGLLRGLGVALMTTIVGSVTNLWLRVNYRMLATAAHKLIRKIG